jgi:ribonuclease R
MKTDQLLHYFEKHQGKEISRKEIDRLTAKKPRRLRRGFVEIQDTEEVLQDLISLGLIQFDQNTCFVRRPFYIEAKISMNPAGLIFGVPRLPSREKERVRDLFIPPAKSAGALSGDIVAVRLVDRKKGRFEGEVISIIRRARRFHRFRVLASGKDGMAPGVLLDMPGKYTSLINLKGLSADTRSRIKPDTVLIVQVSNRKVRYQNAFFHEARFVRFEDETQFDLDFDRILLKYDLDPVYPDLSFRAVDPDDPAQVPDWKKRKDLRWLYTITIDGADSKDFDDALSLEIISKRKWRLYVHIADVSFYVEKDSPLDREAQSRSTSYYLANRVVPMLPPELSENLCSLIAGHNRLAVTAEMDIDPATGRIQSSTFYRSIIQVDRRYTYEIADSLLDGKEDPILPALWELAQKQRADRMKLGRIDLEIPEPSFQFGPDDRVIAIETRKRLRSSMLIEESMLSANTAVAACLKKKKVPTLYRIHTTMDETKLETLNTFFDIYNIDCHLHDTDPASLQEALHRVREKGDLESRIFNIVLLRSFMQAQYSPEPAGHWGLGFKDYCHFTSPIRRYPDLVVHRSLLNAIEKKRPAYTEEELYGLALHTSEKERHAMDAERDMWKLKLIRFIEQSGRTEFHGFLTGFRPDLVYLELEECPVEGIVPAMYLSNEGELVLPDPFSVYIKRLSRPAFLGERWKLELDRIDTEALRLYFKPIWQRKNSGPNTQA